MRRFNWNSILLALLGVALELVPRLIVNEINTSSTIPVIVSSERVNDHEVTVAVKTLPLEEDVR